MIPLTINNRCIGVGAPAYIVAEMSANHLKDFERAVKIIQAAKSAGADAIKLQTYTSDTMTIECDNEYFKIMGTIWEGKNLYKLYGEACTPWEWQPALKKIANDLGLDFFSSPFDTTAVDFLEDMGVPAYKVASSEVVDLPLLRKIAKTNRPIIMSTGMATLAEISEAIQTIREAGGEELCLLKCTSAYPAPFEEMNLRTIPHLAEAFGFPVGLSDHTRGIAIAVAGVTLGACIIEKHLILSREDRSPDSSFSMVPHEFKTMVKAIRDVEKALGKIRYGFSEHEKDSRQYRRSLFVVKDMVVGEIFTNENVRCIRPAHGLHPRNLEKVIGRRAKMDQKRGTPLTWDAIE